MITLKEIARSTRVSVASVSYVINGKKQLSQETTRRINKAIQEANFSPHTLAKSLGIFLVDQGMLYWFIGERIGSNP